MAKSSKGSRSKGNSLPPTKRFDFIMVDDDFEELQCSFVPKETNAAEPATTTLHAVPASRRGFFPCRPILSELWSSLLTTVSNQLTNTQ